MSAPVRSGFGRLVDVTLPHGGLVMSVVEGYFDESGDLDEAPHVFCVAGYYLSEDAARAMDAAWREVLLRYDVPYFHMVDCAHGRGVFAGKAKEQRTELVKELIGLIKVHTIEGFSAICYGREIAAARPEQNVYTLGVDMCLKSIQSFLEVRRSFGRVSYFFESGHKNRGHAYNYVAAELKRLGASLTFGDKAEMALLQAADLLAWQTTKFVKDRIQQKRPPRQDFLSLMEHPHALVHAGLDGDNDKLSIEYYPLSRRSRYTSAFTVDRDGPIVLMREEGDSTPLIFVSATLGWGRGSVDDLTYVGFSQLAGGAPFGLAFDASRLHEAAGVFLAAAAANPVENMRAVLLPTRMTVENTVEGVVFTFGLPSGGTITLGINALDVEKDLSALIDRLNQLIDERSEKPE